MNDGHFMAMMTHGGKQTIDLPIPIVVEDEHKEIDNVIKVAP